MGENGEKGFKHYLELSESLRQMLINKMEPDDRCRLTPCSKLCNKETKASKNYIYELHFSWHPDRLKTIRVLYKKYDRPDEKQYGYALEYFDTGDEKFKVYLSLDAKELWRDKLDSSTDLDQLARQDFENLLQRYQSNVKMLHIDVSNDNILEIGSAIDSFDNLEELELFGVSAISRILSKLQKPLKTLIIDKEEEEDLSNCEQIYQVQNEFIWFNGALDYQQLLQLDARDVTLSIGSITETQIFSFIRSWQDATIRRDIGSYCFELKNSKFNTKKLLELLEVEVEDLERDQIDIEHFIDVERSAVLAVSENFITFDATTGEEDF